MPGSNYRTLRDTNDVFIVATGPIRWINWQADQIKINHNDPSYLIGTNGNDRFSANYDADKARFPYCNTDLLRHFLGGDGTDLLVGFTDSNPNVGTSCQRTLSRWRVRPFDAVENTLSCAYTFG